MKVMKMPLNPSYLEKAVQQTQKFEGRKPRVYLDPKRGRGIPTIGYGYALADENGRLKPHEVINADINKASGTKGVEYFSTDDMRKLQNARYDLDVVGVGPRLSDEQMNGLLKMKLEEHAAQVDKKLQTMGVERGKLTNAEYEALIDLSYRGGDNLFGKSSPTLNKAIQQGDIAGMIIEIKYGSNGDNLPGNDTRNDKLVKDIWDQLSPEEREIVKRELEQRMKEPRNQKLKDKYEERQKGRTPTDQGPFKPSTDGKNPQSSTPSSSSKASGPSNAGGEVFVHSYSRRTGDVQSHTRSSPDGNTGNNFGVRGSSPKSGSSAGIREPGPNEKRIPGVLYLNK